MYAEWCLSVACGLASVLFCLPFGINHRFVEYYQSVLFCYPPARLRGWLHLAPRYNFTQWLSSDYRVSKFVIKRRTWKLVGARLTLNRRIERTSVIIQDEPKVVFFFCRGDLTARFLSVPVKSSDSSSLLPCLTRTALRMSKSLQFHNQSHFLETSDVRAWVAMLPSLSHPVCSVSLQWRCGPFVAVVCRSSCVEALTLIVSALCCWWFSDYRKLKV